MAQGSHPRVETKLVDQNLLDVLGLDWVQIFVECTFSDNDNRLSLSDHSVLKVSYLVLSAKMNDRRD